MMKILTVALVILSPLMAMSASYAEDARTDKFKFAIGGYTLTRYDSEISVTEPHTGAGVSVNPEDTFGLKTEQSVFRIDGYYRFNENHALTYSWYRISSDGNKSVDNEINWVDKNGNAITIPIGASVNTSLDYDIYKLGYLWSFYHNDKVELSAGAGLHITRIAIGLQADTTSSGIDATDVAMTVPLPVLTFGLTYYVTPKFSWYFKTEIFSLAYQDWEGVYTDTTAGVEYRAWKHVGLGFALANNSLKVTEDTSKYKFTYDNRISGGLLYVAAYY